MPHTRQVLGKRLGKEMAAVAKAVAAMTPAQIGQYERSGTAEVGGVQLQAGEIKVRMRAAVQELVCTLLTGLC